MKLSIICSLIMLSFLSSLFCADQPEGAEKFFKDPTFFRLLLSPDGEWVAGITTEGKGGERDLLVTNIASLKQKHYQVNSGENVYNYHWVSERDIVFNVSKWDTYVSGVYGVNLNRKGIKTIFDSRIVARIVDPMPFNPDFSWLRIRGGEQRKERIGCLKKKLLRRGIGSTNPGFVDNTEFIAKAEYLPSGECFSCITDNRGDVRILCHATKGGRIRYLHRSNSDDKWAELKLNPEDWNIIDFSSNDEALIVSGYGEENTIGLYQYDLQNEEFVNCLFRDDHYDLTDSTHFKMFNGNLIGFTYEKVAPTSVWFVPQIKMIQESIDKNLPGRANVITSWNKSFDRFLIQSYSDKAPMSYYFMDIKNKELKLLLNPRPWIKESECAPTQVLKFKTKDGLTLESYVTTPKIGKAPYPTVCLVHGGPWARDGGGFNSEVQYLASMGFAVLRVNYRGSDGYGKEVSKDNAYAFDKMGDDIIQACKILIKSGHSDAQRMGIMGSSFGGFASLQGVTNHPDFFKCAVSVAGVFDWEEMIKSRKRQRHYYDYSKLLSNLKKDHFDDQYIFDLSPINHVENIKVPVFIAHGKADHNVSAKQSRKLVSKLKDLGIPHETYYKEWMGHCLSAEKSRIELYERIGAFLTTHLL